MEKCPVCGMAVDIHKSTHVLQHGGEEYYFCSAGCKEKFEQNPQQYVRA